MATTTTIHGLPIPEPDDRWALGNEQIAALGSALDPKLTPFTSGVLASRPTSTPGSPGKAGLFYFATDTGQFFVDYGTGWLEAARDVPTPVTITAGADMAAGTTPTARLLDHGRVALLGSLVASASVASGATIGTIGATARPLVTRTVLAVMRSGGAWTACPVLIYTDGSIELRNGSGLTTGNQVWLDAITYSTA